MYPEDIVVGRRYKRIKNPLGGMFKLGKVCTVSSINDITVIVFLDSRDDTAGNYDEKIGYGFAISTFINDFEHEEC